jgi:membrane protease YdiL (CAAX protease family)
MTNLRPFDRAVEAMAGWIRGHQVAAFYLIAFAITWGLGFSYSAVLRGGKYLLIPLASVATCGPALAGILVSAVCNRASRSGSFAAPWIAFAVALVVATLVYLAHQRWVNGAPVSPAIVALTLALAVPVAFVISAAYSRLPTVRRTLASLVHPRGAIGWSLLALALMPTLHLFSVAVGRLLGRQPAPPSVRPASGLALVGVAAIQFLYQFFFYNCIGEEVGWSGFARPRLQARTSPLVASLVMTFFWAIWHAFLWRAEGQPILAAGYWLQTLVRLAPASVIIGWFYNRSRGSILVAGVVHAAANTAFAVLPGVDWRVHTAITYGAALAMVLVDRMWAPMDSSV